MVEDVGREPFGVEVGRRGDHIGGGLDGGRGGGDFALVEGRGGGAEGEGGYFFLRAGLVRGFLLIKKGGFVSGGGERDRGRGERGEEEEEEEKEKRKRRARERRGTSVTDRESGLQ